MYKEKNERDILEMLKADDSFEGLSLVYQPIIDLKSLSVIGLEALLRWKHKDYGDIQPGQFIPVAEKHGLIGSITMAVVAMVERDLNSYNDFFADKFVSINISLLDLYSIKVMRFLEKHYLTMSSLCKGIHLEIIETYNNDSFSEIDNGADQLTLLGYNITLDDFGSGYSGIEKLICMDLHGIKIDQLIVRYLTRNKKSYEILRQLNEFFMNNSIFVICEGIESKEEERLLKGLGYQYVQGYLYYKPNKLSEIIEEINSVRFSKV